MAATDKIKTLSLKKLDTKLHPLAFPYLLTIAPSEKKVEREKTLFAKKR